MSRRFKNRQKAIRDEKRRRGVTIIPAPDFFELQAKWRHQRQGAFLGTLEQVCSKIGGNHGG